MSIIGLTGHSRAGKDTVAGILVELYGYEQRVMADPIRQILVRMGLVCKEDVQTHGWDWIKEHYPETVDWMIGLGQAARDVIDPEIWLAPVFRNVPPRLVISDVRQPNEVEAIRKAGGVIWKVIRPGTRPRAMDSLLDHYEFDCYIYNTRGLDALEPAVQHAHEGTVGLEAD